MNTAAPLKDIKRGDFIRLKDTHTAPVWVRGDYDKSSKTYSLQSCDDISRSIQRKGTVTVFHGFTY